MSLMIDAQNLSRFYGELKAVDGVSFKVNRGEVLGFLGPNGAGKSTTMKMLTCFLAPSSGTAKIAGFDILTNPKEARASVGYLPENAPLYGEMRVHSFLRFCAEMRSIPKQEIKSAIERVVELTSLGAVLTQRIENLSKGFKRRVGLAQALIHDPEILILDEPTDGLDPNQKHEVRKLINSMAAQKCIVLSTHILEEVEEVCTRAVIIAQGKVVADDTPENLKRRSSLYGAVTISFKEPMEWIESLLRTLPGIDRVQEHEAKKSFTLYPKEGRNILPVIVQEAEKKSWEYQDIYMSSGSLDEVFRNITTRE